MVIAIIILSVLLVASILVGAKHILRAQAAAKHAESLFLRAQTLLDERKLFLAAVKAGEPLTEAKVLLIIRAVEENKPELLARFPQLRMLYQRLFITNS